MCYEQVHRILTIVTVSYEHRGAGDSSGFSVMELLDFVLLDVDFWRLALDGGAQFTTSL